MKIDLESSKSEQQPSRATKLRLTLGAWVVLAFILLPRQDSTALPNDFAFHWIAAKLVLAGSNPYSPQETLDLQRRLSFAGKGPLVALSPPWVLPLVVPFGWLSFATATSLWFALGLGTVLVSIRWLWDLYAGSTALWIGWLVTALFLPVAVVLAIGQIGPLVLLGLTGFLRYEGAGSEYVAGAFLFLVALKPHLVFLVWIAVLFCAFSLRLWRTLVAFFAALVCASFLAVAVDRRVFQQYVQLLTAGHSVLRETPTLSGLLRHFLSYPGVQFIPMVLALVWFARLWTRWRGDWIWRDRLPELLLLSIVATSYSWFFDQVVLLPCVLSTTAVMIGASPRIRFAAFAVYVAINGLVLLFLLQHRTTFWYSWTACAWLLLYVVLGHLASSARRVPTVA